MDPITPVQLEDSAAVLLHSIHYGHCACKTGATCKHPGKHPLKNNFLRSPTLYTPSPENNNLGILTGSVNNLTVLDIDPKNGGHESLAKLISDYGPLPKTLEVRTGGGGTHLYFSGVTDTRQPLPGYPGIDLQGEKTYVVAPPSLHVSGKQYQWVDESTPIVLLPDVIYSLAAKKTSVANEDTEAKETDAKKLDLDLVLRGIPEGERHDQLFCYAARLKRKGLNRDEAMILIEEVAKRCSPPFFIEEAVESLDAAWKYPNDTAYDYVLKFVKSKDCEYTLGQRFVALHLAEYMTRKDTCWPGIKRLAIELGVDQDTIGSALKVLSEEDGLFKRVGKNSEYGTWVYELNRCKVITKNKKRRTKRTVVVL